MIVLSIPGTPIAKKRPRFSVRNGKPVVYNDQETEEGRLLWEIRQQFEGAPLEGPVHVSVESHFEPPKSSSKKNLAAMLAGEIKHVKKPDCDNILKFLLDVMNGTVWIDDCQVVSAMIVKSYAQQAKTIIKVVELDKNQLNNSVLPEDF